MNWTEADVQRVTEGKLPVSVLARGVRKPGVMNGVEAAYAAQLEVYKHINVILWYAFEAITLKLAPDTRYTPDFVVMTSQGFIECHEVKGFFRDDAKVKIKVAAAMFPFRFLLVRAIPKKEGGGWRVEEV